MEQYIDVETGKVMPGTAAKQAKATRRTYTVEEKEAAVKEARHIGVAAAARKLDIAECSVRTWYDASRKAGFKKEVVREQLAVHERGRKPLMSPAELQQLACEVDTMRDPKTGLKVTARHVAATARGLSTFNKRGHLLLKNGGNKIYSRSWANSVLKQCKFNFLCATTDRTVDERLALSMGSNFMYEVSRAGCEHPQLAFNMDEYCAGLFSCGKRQSWHRAAEARRVVLRDCKLAFTCSVTSNAAGAVVGCQMIWHGKTTAVHAEPPSLHPLILQDHQPDSHYQDSSTFARYAKWLVEHVGDVRKALNKPDAKALLVIDVAPQHTEDALQLLKEHNIEVVKVPPKCTHLYQPADQFIIAALKAIVMRAHDDYVEHMYATHGPGKTVEVLASTALKSARANYYEYLGIAIEALNAEDNHTVENSWAICGLLKALFTEVPRAPKYVPHIDELYRKLSAPCEDCRYPWCIRVCPRCSEHVCRVCWGDAHQLFCVEEPKEVEPPAKKSRKEKK